MKIKDNILQTIGNTPMIRLNKIVAGIPANIFAKVEYFNPGNSVKDRMAIKMIEDAEKSGKLKPNGTIVEGTSGNTGMGLALGAIVKGYKLICVTTDKQSKEKVDILKAVGAEVVICPTNVDPDDENSYYSTSKRLSLEIENSWYVNQYDNLSNSEAHYLSTGPEIWEQMSGHIHHFVVGVGTGGTISGVGKFLKEKNNKIKIWGIDSYGSVFKKYHETGKFDKNEIYPYLTEGIGEDILPENVDFKIIDHFEKVTDEDAAVFARRLAKKEGILAGYSCGAAIAGLHQLKSNFKKNENVVVLLHDSGTRYIGKVYNDEWMKKQGFKLD
ncbi:MAG: cystathionine beta-synthase [Flavobacteriales bacterium]|jgi:cystathionine beta-synthase|nr:cystathionine beta-synthase [Flavobacteriales bacterium]|tara:strand:+ start:280 stop:1263 length:984 start_codon:yes stop_codon:yes gene_type:complete